MTSTFFRLNYPTQARLDQLIASQGLAGLAPELGTYFASSSFKALAISSHATAL